MRYIQGDVAIPHSLTPLQHKQTQITRLRDRGIGYPRIVSPTARRMTHAYGYGFGYRGSCYRPATNTVMCSPVASPGKGKAVFSTYREGEWRDNARPSACHKHKRLCFRLRIQDLMATRLPSARVALRAVIRRVCVSDSHRYVSMLSRYQKAASIRSRGSSPWYPSRAVLILPSGNSRTLTPRALRP